MVAIPISRRGQGYETNASVAGRSRGADPARPPRSTRAFGLTLPFLMLLMFGPMDFLKALHGWQHVSVSVRAAWSKVRRRTIGNWARGDSVRPAASPLFSQEY